MSTHSVVDDKRARDFSVELDVTLRVCQAVRTPRAITVYMLLSAGEYEQYLDLTIDASNYLENQTEKFGDDYLVTNVLRKSPNIPVDINPTEVALENWRESEERCRKVNALDFDSNTWELLHRTKDIISMILGPLNKSVLADVVDSFHHGSGSVFNEKLRGSVPSDKYRDKITLTPPLYPFARSIMGETWTNSIEFVLVPGDELSSVPKNAKTDRMISKMPKLNMYYQLGVAQILKRRLTRFGIRMTDQSYNQLLAKKARANGLATIDFSSASDSISYGLIKFLLPERWFALLDLGRVTHSLIKSDSEQHFHLNEKFSAMGCGFTFELESIIFLSLALALTNIEEWHHVSIYGDDLIMPSKYASDLAERLSSLGLIVNTNKSFLAGNFYESCGADFFCDFDVRPFFLKGKSKGLQIPYEMQIANAIRLYSLKRLNNFGCDKRFFDVWKKLVDGIPKKYLYFVPPIFGDLGVIGSIDDVKCQPVKYQPRKPGTQIEGMLIIHLKLDMKKRVRNDTATLLHQLAMIGSQTDISYRGRETILGYLGRIQTSWSIIRNWPSYLSWV
jgi:hypothetical protein